MDSSLIKFLQTKPTVALVGATNDRRKYGNVILKDLTGKSFIVIPVNSKATNVEGIPAYHDLTLAKDKVSNIGLVIFVVPPSMGLPTLREAKRLGLNKVWFQPGAANQDIIDYAEGKNMSYITDECVMVESF